jgi:hypothetical protein
MKPSPKQRLKAESTDAPKSQQQAFVDREYVLFLELRNQRLEALCRQAKALLDSAFPEPTATGKKPTPQA